MSTNLHVQHFVKTQNRGCWGLYTFRIVLRCFDFASRNVVSKSDLILTTVAVSYTHLTLPTIYSV